MSSPTPSPILSANDLAWRIGVPLKKLRAIAADIHRHYRVFTKGVRPDVGRVGPSGAQPVISGADIPSQARTFRVPNERLMDVQRRIAARILKPLCISAAAHGGVRGCSPATNAAVHLGQRRVVNLDVRKFFDNVRHEAVFRMFRHELNFGRDVASLLTKLTTFDSLLPQGAPTSTYVANLLLARAVDAPAERLAEQHGLRYTRFVDDLTFSGDDPRPVINKVAKLLSTRRLKMYRRKSRGKVKLKITPRSGRQEVTGLVVNAATPTISRARRDAVRAAVHGLKSIGESPERDTQVRSIRGRIAYIRRHHPGAALRLERSLKV
jgi:RNA-directed DNA polymerase